MTGWREEERSSPYPVIRTAYVILTHSDWPQTERLLRAIRRSSPDSFVLVWHDGRTTTFPEAVEDPRIEVCAHQLATDWGSWELVEATLLAFEHVRELVDPELVVLVSGQDYPVRRLADWEADVIASGSWVGNAVPLRYVFHWGRRRGEGRDELTRYTHRWFQTPCARLGIRLGGATGDRLRQVRAGLALRLEPFLSVRVVTRGRGVFWGVRRRTPFSSERPCHLGSQWLAVPRVLLDGLLDEDLAPGSQLRRFYRRTIIPDESALVTPLSWRATPAPLPPVTHMVWDEVRDRPVTWSTEDLDALVGSGSPFCRKVNPVTSAQLLDELDRRIA